MAEESPTGSQPQTDHHRGGCAAATWSRLAGGWCWQALLCARAGRTTDTGHAAPSDESAKLFAALRKAGVRIGVVTSDDLGPTEATLNLLGVRHQVGFLACADAAIQPSQCASRLGCPEQYKIDPAAQSLSAIPPLTWRPVAAPKSACVACSHDDAAAPLAIL